MWERIGSIMGRQQEPEFAGRLEFQLEPDKVSNGAMIRLPSGDVPASDVTRVRFRYFQRVEGSLPLPSGIVPQQVLVRLLEGDKIRASQNVSVVSATGVAPDTGPARSIR